MRDAGLRACGCGKPLPPPPDSRRFRCLSCSRVYDRHWRRHGPSSVAMPGSWKTQPPQGEFVAHPVRWTFSAEDLERLRWGFVPRVMEDKWFILAEGSSLRFYRSWTGQFCYSARLTDDGIDGVEIPRELRGSAADPGFIRGLIEGILIGRDG
jgi:hypothetical protein